MQNCVAEKKRIFKLAEDLKIEALEIIAYLKSEGIEGISAASHVDGERVQDIKDHFSGKKVKKKPAKTEPVAEAKAEVAEEEHQQPCRGEGGNEQQHDADDECSDHAFECYAPSRRIRG